MLYLIPFLHQTTTALRVIRLLTRCILFHFYIKPQQSAAAERAQVGCILFHFYIKPQLYDFLYKQFNRCILFHFYIKPQHARPWLSSW